jgi:ubiquitin carboxyl-terminal hydrolase 47
MTPEVRSHIYSYRYDAAKHGDKKHCIIYQLQKIFAQLQISKSNFIQTRELTASFGWASKDSFEQQDVQEFCRVLFDAIDESFKLTLESKDDNEEMQVETKDQP